MGDSVVMIDLAAAKWVVWGYKNTYHSHTHIQEAYFRALRFLGKSVLWLDHLDKLSGIDFSNTIFITPGITAYANLRSQMQGRTFMPFRKDCFYLLHNPEKKHLDALLEYSFLATSVYATALDFSGWENIDTDVVLQRKEKNLAFRWATDLLPPEIEANKPNRVFRAESRVVNWVGSIWPENQQVIDDFRRACIMGGVQFKHYGNTESQKAVSVEENVRLIQESYMAPAISGPFQIEWGNVPCRVFKNISYGQYGITNSKYSNDLFDGRLIYHPDAHQLFFEAREQLPKIALKDLHSLMDEVAEKHTYLNRIASIIKAIELI